VTDELAERVERGAALLDERRPGWWEATQLGALDLGELLLVRPRPTVGRSAREPTNCSRIGPTSTTTSSGCMASTPLRVANFPVLTDLWRAAIERRRAAERTTP
jgi:hypothetical protein